MYKSLKILLIEDDQIEVMKFNRAIGTASSHTIKVATNGRDAMAVLESFRPDFILLDLNMPDINGIEFLTFLKKNDKLHHIPAVILSTSNNKNDITQCYRIGVAGYVLKPLKYKEYEEKIRNIINYWSLNEFKK